MDADLPARLLSTFVDELDAQVRALNAELLELEASPDDAERIRSLFRIAHTVKGAARVVGVEPVERACHELEAFFAGIREGRLKLAPSHFRLLFTVADALRAAGQRLAAEGAPVDPGPLPELADHLAAAAGGEPVQAEELPAREAGARPATAEPAAAGDGADAAPLRVRSERLDALLASSRDLLIVSGRVRDRPRVTADLHEAAHGWAAEWRHSRARLLELLEAAGAERSSLELVRAVASRLDHIAEGLGELARRTREDARSLGRVADEIGDGVNALRMRPFAEACEALPRAVRDVAEAGGKEARLVVEGEEVEADRAVIDALREPLLHLVRNAVDHGIERPEARQAAGKPPEGTIRVSAELGAGRLHLTVRDDGAGLDVPAIRRELERRGTSAPTRDEDVVRLLFRGGLSTREQTTEISGRGVGLELVQWTLDRIGGSIAADWIPGEGTTFRIECPQNTATVRALLARAGTGLMALPTAHVERARRVRAEELRRSENGTFLAGSPGQSEGALRVRSLAGLLGPPFEARPVNGTAPLVVLRAGGSRLGVLVDELVDEREIVVRALDPERIPVARTTGGALLPDGRIALVLNTAALVAAGSVRAGAEAVLDEPSEAARARPRVLVVDDSLTTRTLEGSVLEAAGYEVRTAADGEAGWRLLRDEGADLVVADIEMPRMDGFELCEAIRRSPRHRELPVILVTALEAAEHRQRGLEAGADAYLPKSSFDQEALLNTIRELID